MAAAMAATVGNLGHVQAPASTSRLRFAAYVPPTYQTWCASETAGLAVLGVPAGSLGAFIAAVTSIGAVRRSRRHKVLPSKRMLARAALGDRAVSFNVQRTDEEVLPRATKLWLDKMMDQHASTILFSGVDRYEPVPGQPQLQYCYFAPVDLGPYRTQMRITCNIAMPSSGRLTVQVLDFNPGVLDTKAGKLEFQANPKEIVEACSEIEMTWEPYGRAAGLRVKQTCSQELTLKVPWWFPVPSTVVEAVIRPFVAVTIGSSQQGVVKSLRQRLARALASGEVQAANDDVEVQQKTLA